LVSLLGTSAFLAQKLVERPELVDVLLAPAVWPDARALAVRIDERLTEVEPGDDEGLWIELGRAHQEALLTVGLLDVAGELDVVLVGERLTDLADVCVARALAEAQAGARRRFPEQPPLAVLGLGKLGSRELGYGADLDLVFVYRGDPDAGDAATRIAQRLVSALSAPALGGRLYEVDTRLRPGGRQGTLVVSLAGWIKYQAESAQLWERQALLRLRAVAGDAALGAEVEAAAQAACFGRPVTDPRALVAELAAMRTRIEKELGQEREGSYDLKTGRGGLVDVEFAAQLVQLRHGPSEPRVRGRGTLAVLAAAAAVGLIDDELHAGLAGGWRFLRRLEHRLRIVHDRPEHSLPDDPAELAKLARRMGFASAGALERQYLVWTKSVRACYEKLLEAAAR
jgi:glutamate-ammonia-ligase adenylyltransferase